MPVPATYNWAITYTFDKFVPIYLFFFICFCNQFTRKAENSNNSLPPYPHTPACWLAGWLVYVIVTPNLIIFLLDSFLYHFVIIVFLCFPGSFIVVLLLLLLSLLLSCYLCCHLILLLLLVLFLPLECHHQHL